MTNSEIYNNLTALQRNELFKHFRGGWDNISVVELAASSSGLFDTFSIKPLQNLVCYMRSYMA